MKDKLLRKVVFSADLGGFFIFQAKRSVVVIGLDLASNSFLCSFLHSILAFLRRFVPDRGVLF